MNLQQSVRQFIVENFYVSDASGLADDTLLVTSGIVDSTGVLEIIAFLEAEFDVHVRDDETIPENLESIERIAAFVARKREAADAQPSSADPSAA
jgi:acyl carrier protein